MFDLTNAWLLVGGTVGGLLVLFGVGTLLFLAGCALADVAGPGFLKALLVYGLTVVLCLPPAAGLVWLAGQYETDPSGVFGPLRAAALGVGVVGAWVLSALVYALLLATPYRKGLVIAGTELFLAGLLAALAAAVVMVVLAVAQLAQKPAPRSSRPPPVAAARARPADS
jgi:hypothetical protein